MADDDAVAAERDRAIDHGPAFGRSILRAVLENGDAERRQCDRRCRAEQPCKAFGFEHIPQDRKSRDDDATGDEAHDIFGHGFSRRLTCLRNDCVSVHGRTSLSTAAPSAKPATTSLAQCASTAIRVSDSAIAAVRSNRRGVFGSKPAAEASAPIWTA